MSLDGTLALKMAKLAAVVGELQLRLKKIITFRLALARCA